MSRRGNAIGYVTRMQTFNSHPVSQTNPPKESGTTLDFF